MATVRRTRGGDIDAACGQLVGRVQDLTVARIGERPPPGPPRNGESRGDEHRARGAQA